MRNRRVREEQFRGRVASRIATPEFLGLRLDALMRFTAGQIYSIARPHPTAARDKSKRQRFERLDVRPEFPAFTRGVTPLTQWFTFREPVSAWTHFLWLLLAFPCTWMLSHRSRGDWVKQTGMLLFGLGLVVCYGGSWLFHAVRLSPPSIAAFHRLDRIGIYLLIAGSGTPVALVVLRGLWRAALLVVLWLLAATGIALSLFGQPIPIEVSTVLYLVMGWIGCVTYFELAHHLSHAKIRLLWIGGVLYTIGALLNVLNWPTLLPGVFGPHEVFHLFVMAGTACHYCFMLVHVAPYRRVVT